MAETKFDYVRQTDVPVNKVYGLSDIKEFAEEEYGHADVNLKGGLLAHMYGDGYRRGYKDAMIIIKHAAKTWILENEKYDKNKT